MIFLPLLPLAEWLANNWWFLQSEPERSVDGKSREFDRRHNLRWAREGFVLPSLRFVTLGQNVEARWQSMDVPDAGVRFLASGCAIVAGSAFEGATRDFINAVVVRLDDMGISETSLHKQWLAIQQADSDEKEFCRAAAQLGVDPYATDDQLEAAILDVANRIRPELLNDFLSLASVDELAFQSLSLARASESIAADAGRVDALERLRRHAPTYKSSASSWEVGYRFARELRAKLNGSSWKSHSLDELAGQLGIDQLDQCLVPEAGECPFLDALVGTNQHRNPRFLVEKRREDSRQFAFCRALFEHLTLPREHFAVVSALRTDRQQMSRAFAAEFLAPHDMLKDDLSGTIVGEDEIDDLAADYGVSAFAIRHQIENHRLARVAF